jgi:addiction module RelE/StbE family toxin
MNVNWTDVAIEHLTAIREFIAKDSEIYAQGVVERLLRRSEQIGRHPSSGRKVPEVDIPQIREVIEGPFRIIYHIKPDQIDVIAVLHGAQLTPWSPYPEKQ